MWEGQSSAHRNAPICLFSILGSPQKLLFEERVLQLIKKCLRTAVLCAMHFIRLCLKSLGHSKVTT